MLTYQFSSLPVAEKYLHAGSAVGKHRVQCHSANPQLAGFTSAPLGVEPDSEEQLLQRAEHVFQTTVTLHTMPLGNLTRMTKTEGEQIASFTGRG